MDYVGLSRDPSFCDTGLKNESGMQEVSYMVNYEHPILQEHLKNISKLNMQRSSNNLVISGVILVLFVTYCISTLSLRVIFIKSIQLKSHQKWKLREDTLPSESRQRLALDDDIDYNQDFYLENKPNEGNLTPHFTNPKRKATQYFLSKSYDYINGQCSSIKVATV